LFPSHYSKSRDYGASGGGDEKVPPRHKRHHGQHLLSRLAAAVGSATEEVEASLVGLEHAATGIYLTFRAEPGYVLPIESLEKHADGIEVVHVQIVDGIHEATVFVPTGKESFFRRKINEYINGFTKTKKPKHQRLVAVIDDIKPSSIIRLWTGDPRHFPIHGEMVWWEVWIRESLEDEFFLSLDRLALERGPARLRFPERVVVIVKGRPEDIDRLRHLTGAIAELRRPLETPHFFVEQQPKEQRDWSDDLLGRLQWPLAEAPAVCILDTGVNRAHPLLAALLDPSDWHAWHRDWPEGDNQLSAHGTAMAGLAAYGDLTAALESTTSIRIGHRLESVRILPPRGLSNQPHQYGAITIGAVAQAEYAAPLRRRAFCLAVTADISDGTPSSWSASIDDLAAGKLDAVKRLFVLSAGNVQGAIEPCDDYLYRCERTRCPDPTQGWNSLVVGACSFLQAIKDSDFAGWTPLAPSGELSPYSATSRDWTGSWAIRPDIVMEGGNLAVSPAGTQWDSPSCLGILTTHHNIPNRFFDTIHATSAAAAQVAWMAAEIAAFLPDCREETIRALIVHSAEWPMVAARKFRNAGLTERGALLRTYGFGVPDIHRALASAANDVAVVIESDMVVVSADGKMSEMQFVQLPWTGKLLRDLGNTTVRMRITLSYFVEANPAARGWKGRYRYASHGFRFHLQRPNESDTAFFARLNKKDRDDDWDGPEGGKDGWFLGSQQRNRGSLHSDFWEGPAIALADRRNLAIVPVGGWWKSRRSPERRAGYSLVVSLSSPETKVDLYTPVRIELANLAKLPVAIVT